MRGRVAYGSRIGSVFVRGTRSFSTVSVSGLEVDDASDISSKLINDTLY